MLNAPGTTDTQALLTGSNAIDKVTDCTDALGASGTTDQRDAPRPDDGEAVCDIGAYEFQDASGFAGTPGGANCHGKSVSALSNRYGTLAAAASTLGYASVTALQAAINKY